MQIVIDIPEEFYEWTKEYWENHPDPKVHSEIDLATLAISRGIILPEKHGRLVDIDILYRVFQRNVVASAFEDLFKNAPTVLEATEKQK